MSVEREYGDPLGSFNCPKCAAITIEPRVVYKRWSNEVEYLWIECAACGYGELRPCADKEL